MYPCPRESQESHVLAAGVRPDCPLASLRQPGVRSRPFPVTRCPPVQTFIGTSKIVAENIRTERRGPLSATWDESSGTSLSAQCMHNTKRYVTHPRLLVQTRQTRKLPKKPQPGAILLPAPVASMKGAVVLGSQRKDEKSVINTTTRRGGGQRQSCAVKRRRGRVPSLWGYLLCIYGLLRSDRVAGEGTQWNLSDMADWKLAGAHYGVLRSGSKVDGRARLTKASRNENTNSGRGEGAIGNNSVAPFFVFYLPHSDSPCLPTAG